jgi:hypothetical protein
MAPRPSATIHRQRHLSGFALLCISLLHPSITQSYAYPSTDHDFFYAGVPAQISFIASSDGKASALVLHLNGRDQTAVRVPDTEAESNDCCGLNEPASAGVREDVA